MCAESLLKHTKSAILICELLSAHTDCLLVQSSTPTTDDKTRKFKRGQR